MASETGISTVARKSAASTGRITSLRCTQDEPEDRETRGDQEELEADLRRPRERRAGRLGEGGGSQRAASAGVLGPLRLGRLPHSVRSPARLNRSSVILASATLFTSAR